MVEIELFIRINLPMKSRAINNISARGFTDNFSPHECHMYVSRAMALSEWQWKTRSQA